MHRRSLLSCKICLCSSLPPLYKIFRSVTERPALRSAKKYTPEHTFAPHANAAIRQYPAFVPNKKPVLSFLSKSRRRAYPRGTTSIRIFLTEYAFSGAAFAIPCRCNRRNLSQPCRSCIRMRPVRCAAQKPCSIRFFPAPLSLPRSLCPQYTDTCKPCRSGALSVKLPRMYSLHHRF